jgi:hypothetical protein
MSEWLSIMSHLPYRFVNDEQPEKPIFPKRVQILIDEYAKAGTSAGVGKKFHLQYQFETIDLHEKIFDDQARRKPESLKITVNAIYRVKNTTNNEEFYYYAATKMCNNALNQPAEPFSYDRYGYHRVPVVTMRWDELKGENVPSVTNYKHGFVLKWDKQEVKKLLDSSSVKCEYFYVGPVSLNSSSEPITDRHYQIQNLQDFLEGSFEDLMDHGRLGIQRTIYLPDSCSEKEGTRK